jgi:hypothetical protein
MGKVNENITSDESVQQKNNKTRNSKLHCCICCEKMISEITKICCENIKPREKLLTF